jgi:hypothetical protein
MEVFELIVRHPGLASRAVAIVGTPVTQARDRVRWEADITRRRTTRPGTAAWQAARTLKPRTALHEWMLSPANYVRQAEAIVGHDVRRRFDGSLERAAAANRSELLVVVSPTDEEVAPGPAVAFATVAHGQVLELDGRCGHQAPVCEQPLVWRTVTSFLSQG